ncbi:hypothetical protein MNBD_GAMMA16-552 [hydrothermal vent metagenome]|uniref:Outer membrane protein W n=1 Tax=hydrothermal vent metagenome TaxID=652676 RepID=A0A3B0ZAW3_9ZZZZ
MKKELAVSIVAGFCLSGIGGAGAASFAAAAKVSTLGLGVEVTTNLLPDVNARVGFNTFNIDRDATEDGIDYEIELEMQTVTGFIDWHPFTTGFRTTLGLVVNGNELNMKARSATSYDIGGTVYTPAQVGTLTGVVGFDNIAPYLGIGWGDAVGADKNWSFVFDLGVLFQGEEDINLSADGLLANNAAFQADLEQEKQQLEQDLDDFELFPVLAFGVSYKF